MRAKPILSLTVLAAALALPGTAASLGLGKLTVQSALGQPLSAQIDLTSIAKEELDSVTARIADPSLYRQNNLAYQGVLARARVSLERLPSGDAVLKVTTPAQRQRALSRPAGRGQLGVGPRRACLHVPARSAGRRSFRSRRSSRSRRARRRGCAARRCRGCARRCGASAPARSEGPPAANTYTVKRGDTLSRIAAGVQAADGDARADAGRAVRDATRTRSTAAT